ncbi:MAG: hypothetical protein ACE5NP_10525 [Anaerolineae bacterium]
MGDGAIVAWAVILICLSVYASLIAWIRWPAGKGKEEIETKER